MTLFGPDGSQFQGVLNWTDADWDSIDFLFWRCGIGITKDPTYKRVEQEALRRNKPFGAYFFPLPVGKYPAAQQANVILDQVDKRVAVMFDWEESKTYKEIPQWSDEQAVAKEVRALGFRVELLYTFPGYWNGHGKPQINSLPVGALTNSTVRKVDTPGNFKEIYNEIGGDNWKGWVGYGGMNPTFCQYTWAGYWCGKPMDFNAFKGTMSELRKYCYYKEVTNLANPKFPQGYDLTGVIYDYEEVGSRMTIKQQLERTTLKNSDHEFNRRLVAVQLNLFEDTGLLMGPGTCWREDNPEVATGSSYHQRTPYNSSGKSRACDTVGLPDHWTVWKAMQKYLNKYGLCSFWAQTDQFNYTGKKAKVKDDPPHIQCYEDNYSKSAGFHNPLPKWNIPARYDLDLIDLDNPLPPVGDNQPGTPPAEYKGDEVGRLITDEETGQYFMVGAGGITGVPNFGIRDTLFDRGIIDNKEPDKWSHADVTAMLGVEDQEIVSRLEAIEAKLGI